MSIPVDLPDLERIMDDFTDVFLIFVNESGKPRVLSIDPARANETLTFEAGARTVAAIANNPNVTVFLPPGAGKGLALIIDGAATSAGGPITITPTSAVLHRTRTPPSTK